MRSGNKNSLKAVMRKILAAFVLVSIAIFLALAITRLSFRELMHTVDELSAPNEKLTILTTVFEEITTLDQLQRAEAIKNPHQPYNAFLEQSNSLNVMIDSLQSLSWDTTQLNRLAEMQEILAERNKLFFSYLKVKAELLDNRGFAVQLDTLAEILQNDELIVDSSLITSHTKTTTTYLKDTLAIKKNQQRSLLRKLFSKKKDRLPDTPRIKIEQEQSVVVDSLAMARQNQAIMEIEKIMRELENDQRTQRRNLQHQELELITANGSLLNQLLGILHEVEQEELQQMRDNNHHAITVMNQSISRTNILMLCFFIAAAILVYLILIDISRSNYYKEQLEKAKDEAEELSQIKQRFLANMSHELRTPLQSIIGFAEQLKQKSTGKDEEVDAIFSSSEHLLHVVNEVLDYSRISSGNFILARENFRLLTLVKEVEAAMRVQAERKHLTFILDSEQSTDFSIHGDPFRLRQILYNIIGNAVKFTQKGFVKLTVKTTEYEKHIHCVFEITDTGIGIETEDLNRIFNQFEQANTSITKQYGGTGLGLTIVRALVEAQHGSIAVSSEAGKGSHFKIELDFDKPENGDDHKTQPAKVKAVAPFNGKVLIIDDDTLILRLCALILKKHHIPFVTFANAQQLYEYNDPQVSHIFLDIRMPDINGIDLCHILRKKYNGSVTFTALTAHVLPEERQNLIKEGFDSILSKPFHESDLLQAIGVNVSQETRQHNEQPDFSMLRKMTMGDESLFQSIMAQFIEETMEDLVKIKHELKEENSSHLREIIHKMAGRLAQIGMISLAVRLSAIERHIVDGYSIRELSAEITRLSKKISDMIIHIRVTTMEQLN